MSHLNTRPKGELRCLEKLGRVPTVPVWSAVFGGAPTASDPITCSLYSDRQLPSAEERPTELMDHPSSSPAACPSHHWDVQINHERLVWTRSSSRGFELMLLRWRNATFIGWHSDTDSEAAIGISRQNQSLLNVACVESRWISGKTIQYQLYHRSLNGFYCILCFSTGDL